MFGTVAEKNVAIVIDVSGSMKLSLPFLQCQLGMLLYEQILPVCNKFTILAFSDTVTAWTGRREDNTDHCVFSSYRVYKVA